MKKFYKPQSLLYFSILLSALQFGFSAGATVYPISQVLSGAQEVPANSSAGTATLIGTYNDVTNTISYTLTFSGLSSNSVQGHFHAPAAQGTNAPVIIPFAGFPAGVRAGSYTSSNVLTDAQEVQLFAGLFYANIHTVDLPNGELRAQVILQGLPAANAYTTCPDADIAVARPGINADNNNPYTLYNVNTATGTFSQVFGGPFKDPADLTKNLQVNAVGLSKKDGFIYGLTNENTITTTRFLRLDKTYGVTAIGFLPSPTSPTGILGFVNSAAGDVDTAGNYYFTGATLKVGLVLDKFFLGKIANVSSYGPGAGAIAVNYYEIDVSGANCSDYIASLTTDPSNSGLKDFSYNAYTNSFFAYVTYKPTGSPAYKGQLMELRAVSGSSPLKYQMFCNSVINNHTAEVSGVAIDKLGKLTVLFDDGSFGVINKTAGGVYDGTYTQIGTAAVTGLANPLRGDMASCGQQTLPVLPSASAAVITCPNASYFLAKAGNNADNVNPYLLYTVNTLTGAVTLVPGDGLRTPGNPSVFMQVNAIGLNPADGFFYGAASQGTSTAADLVRFDRAYGIRSLGTITPPVSSTGLFGFANAAAGDIDRSNNYWFTGATVNPSSASPTGFMLDKIYLGKIASLSNLTGAGNPSPTYYEIDYSDANCAGFITSIMTDPTNSGLKDMVYNPFTGNFITYLTYKPTGALAFSGQMAELKSVSGSTPLRYKMTCTPNVQPQTAEVAGTLIDNSGNFLVMMTDGTVGKIISTSSGQYNGVYTLLNAAPGLPNPLRGDAASCGGPAAAPLPVKLRSFTVATKECTNNFTWVAENETAFKQYELEQSTGDNKFITIATVPGRRSPFASTYNVGLPAAGKATHYRLKMVDVDGSVSYSVTLNVTNNCTRNFGFVVNPNPATEKLAVNWYGLDAPAQVAVVILNANGSIVTKMTKTAGNGTLTAIDVSSLANGAYWIKAVNEKNGMSFQRNFIKQ